MRKNICELCSSISDTYKGNAEKVVLINTSDVYDGKCTNHTLVENKQLRGQFKKTFKPNDILYSEIRPANRRFAYIDFDTNNYIASTKLMVLRAKEGVNPKYLYQILRGNSTINALQLLAESRSGTFPQITFSELSNIEVNIPSEDVQNMVVSILSSLDAKIETNNKLNEKLEEMAQAIFKSWFVDFEPFKDQPFHETELGMIPEGWEVCYLGDFIHEIETGKREKGGAINYGIPSIGAEKIERISYYDFSSEKYISWDFYNNLKKGKIKDCDVLLYKDGAYTGKSTMFIDNFPYKECAINEHVFILRTNKKRYQSFLYLFLNQKKIKELIHSLASSKAAQPGLNQKEISSVMFIKPSEDILNNFENMIFPLLKHIVHNLKENQRLASLRDTLLPRLMSGEIKI